MKTIMVFIFIFFQIIGISQTKNFLKNNSLDTLTTNMCGTTNTTTVLYWGQNLFNDPIAFNACIIDTIYSVPKNQGGFQFAKHGSGYSGISVIGGNYGGNFRVYLQSKLQGMLKNKSYYVYTYISLADKSLTATSRIQIAITQNKLISNTCCQNLIPLPSGFTPQIQNLFGNFITDTSNWLKFGGSFKANGNEQYITIGNFYTDINTDTLKFTNSPNPLFVKSDYYVDDMHLVEEDRAVAYFDTTLENGVCVNLGDSIQLGDTLVRPWLFYEWKDAAGNVVGTTRNIMYQGTTLGNTFYTLSISDTAADAYITKIMDTVYITTSTNCPTSLKNLIQQSNAVRFSIKNNELSIYNLPPSIKNGSIQIRGIDGKLVWVSPLLPSARVPAPLAYRGQGSASVVVNQIISKPLSQGFYFVALLESGNVIARRKVSTESGVE
jgi:hypothetical protein